jgi:GNAT superfamily N-acetyltransferase
MATLDDLDVLVRHRIQMFVDMGVPVDREMLAREFASWLREHMPSGAYRAWIVQDADAIAGGGGAELIAWPPGPTYPGRRAVFVFNVYTEPAYRRRGVARTLMTAIHQWSAQNGATSVALNASAEGRPLYEALGYAVSPRPMMFLSLSGYNPSA